MAFQNSKTNPRGCVGLFLENLTDDLENMQATAYMHIQMLVGLPMQEAVPPLDPRITAWEQRPRSAIMPKKTLDQ